MTLSEETKIRMYFDAILSEKARQEHEIRHRTNNKNLEIGSIISLSLLFLYLLNLFISNTFKSFSLSLLIMIMILLFILIIYFIIIFLTERKQLEIIRNITYPRYIQTLDKICEPNYDFLKLREKYQELRKLEKKDMIGELLSYKLLSKSSEAFIKRYNMDINKNEAEKLVREYVEKNEVKKATLKHYWNITKILMENKDKLIKKEREIK